MEVILLERIEKLGQMGDRVTVKPGYARNFLLPKAKALRATAENNKHFETQRAQLEAVNLEKRSEAEKIANKLDSQKAITVKYKKIKNADHFFTDKLTLVSDEVRKYVQRNPD